ncbi:aminotransferase class V-fold PLP-dependent enzyme [Pseudoalteromonas sp. SMS1]|uniref:aminotransferase class V-fold PLP-dependent enzyme n=1 Tax=Pseudoalteromonas sp. SMS1 TaxID=2908894 RepID=UPI001F3BBDDB|nr:aminotransferase class V-fold PLP-dependent enzyme [Pseudoalteromonas sp. SMS1]MCF2858533.1 aminotransferase class V-fold PLP-dependent enzyme [Pseudoalteromonas sp. SMS1]
MKASDFHLPTQDYLLSHSVGRMMKTAQRDFDNQFMAPWQQLNQEPWAQWLEGVERFRTALANLLGSQASHFCPQTNLSSGLTKWLMSLPQCHQRRVKVLLSEHDFPSMGFVLQRAMSEVELTFIPDTEDMSCFDTWQRYVTAEHDLVFISHVYSNTGQQAPVQPIIEHAKRLGCRVVVDIAQAAGILPIDLHQWQADCVVGSSVKWLCGGPGAGFLWVNPEHITQYQPKDVGWFSHQDPFEFDIHHFAPHDSALRFWGGTPSVAPYILAGHSIGAFAQVGIEEVRAHNIKLLEEIWQGLTPWCVSPRKPEHCSGTAIINPGEQLPACIQALQNAGIAVDARKYGIRVSPHIYNDRAQILRFIDVVQRFVD